MNADKPASGDGKPDSRPDGRPDGGNPKASVSIQAIRDWFARVLHALIHKVWPAIRSFATRAAKAIRSAAAQAAGAIARTGRRIASAGSQLIADLRPSAVPAGTAGASAGNAHVYLVRRIVVFGAAALIVLAIVLGIVFGVRALGGGADAGNAGSSTRSQTVGSADEPGSDSSKNGSGKDAAEAQAGNTDNADTSDQQSAPEPLTVDERATILAEAERTASESGSRLITYTYCIASKGEVGDLTEFADTVYSTLNDPRGWPRAGATFRETDGSDPNACSMTLTLAAPDQMTSFSTECSDEYSCRVGNDVIINIDRWNNATEGWLQAGGTVERYRTMVINHEVGHRLGHLDNELTCPAVDQPAPLMQQQSMDLLGCTPNEWPLDEELWVSE